MERPEVLSRELRRRDERREIGSRLSDGTLPRRTRFVPSDTGHSQALDARDDFGAVDLVEAEQLGGPVVHLPHGLVIGRVHRGCVRAVPSPLGELGGRVVGTVGVDSEGSARRLEAGPNEV